MKKCLVTSGLALILTMTGCGSASNGALDLPQRCTNERSGYSVSYPAGWSTNDGAVISSCSAFDPDPVEIPEASEIPFDIAVVLDVENVSFRELAQPSRWETVDSARSTQIAGRPALRVQSVATGEGLAPEGMRTTRYVIDLGDGRSLVASTHSAEGTTYDRNRRVLDEMVRTISFAR